MDQALFDHTMHALVQVAQSLEDETRTTEGVALVATEIDRFNDACLLLGLTYGRVKRMQDEGKKEAA